MPRWFETMPVWLRTIGLIALGWLVTLVAIYIDAAVFDLGRVEAFILAGPVVTIAVPAYEIREALAVRRLVREAREQSPSHDDRVPPAS